MSILNGTTAPTVRLQYDAARPLGPKNSPTWTNLSSSVVRSVSIRRGKTQENQAVQPGECTFILDNRSGDFDPMNSSSPYWISTPPFEGYSYFSKNLGIRVVATWNDVDYVLFTGYLEQLNMDYGLNPTTTITCVDALAWIAQQNLAAIPTEDSVGDPIPAVGNGDQVWYRVTSLLDASDGTTNREGCNFPSTLRGIDTSVDNTMYGTRYGSDTLTLLQQAADCGPARLFVDCDGLVRLLRWDGGDDNGLLLSDDVTNPDAVGYDSIEIDPGSRYLLNTAYVSKIDGNGVVRGVVGATNNASIARFLPVTASYELPTNTATPVATFLANQYAEPFDRVRRISFSVANLGTDTPKVLVNELADYVSVERTTMDGRLISFTCQIEGLEYDITPDSFRSAVMCSTLEASGGETGDYWFGFMGSADYNPQTGSVAVDSAGNEYVSGTSGANAFLAKINTSGVIQWQRTYEPSSPGESGIGLQAKVLSDDSVVFVTSANSGMGNPTQINLVRIDPTDGGIVWQKELTDTSGFNFSLTIDTADNIYVTGNLSGNYFLVMKFDADGVLLWEKYPTSTAAGVVYGSEVHSSGDLIVYGYIYAASYIPYVARFTASGTLAWQTRLGNRSGAADLVACDLSGNTYIASSTIDGMWLHKYNSSNTLVWKKIYSSSYQFPFALQVFEDAIYLMTKRQANATTRLVKLDGEGSVLWQRNFTDISYATLSLSAIGDIYLTGQKGANCIVGKIPGNGSKTGSYNIVGPFTVTVDYNTETPWTLDVLTEEPIATSVTFTDAINTVATGSLTMNEATRIYAVEILP